MKNFWKDFGIAIPLSLFLILLAISIINISDLNQTERQKQVSADTSVFIEDTTLNMGTAINNAWVIYASKKIPVKIIFDNGETLTTDMETLVKKILREEK